MSAYEADIAAELNAALAENAALRASNAEMLAALREVAVLGHGRCVIGKPLAVIIRAAIARATEAAS